MPGSVGPIVAGALQATAPAEAWRCLVDGVRAAWDAERAVLLRTDAPDTPYVAPAGSAAPDLATLAPALAARKPVVLADPVGRETRLALALRPGKGAPWCLVAARPASAPWTADERAALADAAPVLLRALEYGLVREQLTAVEEWRKAAAAAQEEGLNVMSHELRNPLAPILMWTTTLKRLRPDDLDVERAANAIAAAVSIARRLIEDMLDVSRLQRGAVEIARQPIDVGDLVRQAIEHERAALEQARLALVETVPPEPLRVEGDAQRLTQVLHQLIGNAIKFTPAGGKVTVTLGRSDGRARLTVSDNGSGVPAEVRPRLFTPFSRGPNAHAGLGVGLAIARALVALHRGSLEALERGEEGGASFVVTLPLVS
jgi:signal transduction histidine kinase